MELRNFKFQNLEILNWASILQTQNFENIEFKYKKQNFERTNFENNLLMKILVSEFLSSLDLFYFN